MMTTQLCIKLYAMRVGDVLHYKKRLPEKGVFDVATFIRVPSGWVYQSAFRNNVTSCFIPYSEIIKHEDKTIKTKKCFSCKSSNIVVVAYYDTPTDKEVCFVRCDSCHARGGDASSQEEATLLWNKISKVNN